MSIRTRLVAPALLLGALSASASAAADFFYVSATGPYHDIQSAINAAGDGDTVLVSNGTWTGAANRGLDLGGREITIRSASGDATACIIDCGHNDRAITFDAADGNAVLEDLTIRNGTAGQGAGVLIGLNATPMLRNVRITNCIASGEGGAVRIWEGADVTIEDCVFSVNTAGENGGQLAIGSAERVTILNTNLVNNSAAEWGGGAHVFLGTGDAPDVTFENCLMQANDAAYGGAVSADHAAPLIFQDCTIYQNDATASGGAIYLFASTTQVRESAVYANDAITAGAVRVIGGSADFRRTRFQDNEALHSSAVRYEAAFGRLDNCRFLGNAGGSELGIWENSFVHMANALFSGNQGQFVGAGVYVGPDCEALLTSSTFSRNHSDAESGGAVYAAGLVSFHNSIAWGNDASGGMDSADQLGGTGSFDLESSCVQNLDMSLYSGSNNTDADPLFVDPLGSNGVAGDENDDCRLQSASPAIDAGDNGRLIVDLFDLDADMLIAEIVPLDLDDTDRIKNGTTDMGAYEREPSALPGDLDGNGAVDVTDLVILITNWGTDAPGADLAAPYDIVTVDDLVVIFLNWS